MHHIYHTHGFILSSRNSGEANKILYIYTKELGLVRASVQGVRLSNSKLRFALQDFSYAKIDLVQGREFWKVTSATSLDTFALVKSSEKSLALMASVSKLIERLCVGEQSNEKIFHDLIEALSILNNFEIKDDLRKALELHLVLRIMNSLGYIGDSEILIDYLNSPFTEDQIEGLLSKRKSIISHINKAIIESHL